MKSPRIMFMYAGFVIVCSAAAFILAADKSRATTALYAGGGAAVLMILCGFMARTFPRNRTLGMIGIHLGMGLPVLFAIEFARRSYANLATDTGKTYLGVIFGALAVASVFAFIAILRTRPKPTDRTA